MKTFGKIALAAALIATMAVISGCSSCGTSACYGDSGVYVSSETIPAYSGARQTVFADGSTYVTAE